MPDSAPQGATPAQHRAPHHSLHPPQWNSSARRNGSWEVNLIQSAQINAFCMPGGKIAFYTGILEKLALSDDETAMIMGHEMAHALREHARARGWPRAAPPAHGACRSRAQLLGLGQLGDVAANLGTQLLTLKFSREDETEADLVGLELAARSGLPAPRQRHAVAEDGRQQRRLERELSLHPPPAGQSASASSKPTCRKRAGAVRAGAQGLGAHVAARTGCCAARRQTCSPARARG